MCNLIYILYICCVKLLPADINENIKTIVITTAVGMVKYVNAEAVIIVSNKTSI